MDDDRLGHASLDRLCWEETGYGKEDSMKGRQITLAPAGFTDPDARPSMYTQRMPNGFGRLPIGVYKNRDS